MSTKRKQISQRTKDWKKLGVLIKNYKDAAIADAEKGGGDPADYDAITAMLALQEALLNAQITKMQREEGTQE